MFILQEKRKTQIDSEIRRLGLLKRRFALHKELVRSDFVFMKPLINAHFRGIPCNYCAFNMRHVTFLWYRG